MVFLNSRRKGKGCRLFIGLMAYFDTGWSWLSGAPQKESKGLDELLLKWTDREAFGGPAAAGGHGSDSLQAEE